MPPTIQMNAPQACREGMVPCVNYVCSQAGGVVNPSALPRAQEWEMTQNLSERAGTLLTRDSVYTGTPGIPSATLPWHGEKENWVGYFRYEHAWVNRQTYCDKIDLNKPPPLPLMETKPAEDEAPHQSNPSNKMVPALASVAAYPLFRAILAIRKTAMVMSLFLAADDVTGIGVADNVLLPFTLILWGASEFASKVYKSET